MCPLTNTPPVHQHISRTEGDIQLEGSNASAEGADADEGGDASTVSGVDLVLNHRLTETGFGSKKDYMVYLKDYMKKVVKYLEENDRAGEVDVFKKNINNVMKELLGKFKDLQFFTGNYVTVSEGSSSNFLCFQERAWTLMP